MPFLIVSDEVQSVGQDEAIQWRQGKRYGEIGVVDVEGGFREGYSEVILEPV